jgi:hypothetical protein
VRAELDEAFSLKCAIAQEQSLSLWAWRPCMEGSIYLSTQLAGEWPVMDSKVQEWTEAFDIPSIFAMNSPVRCASNRQICTG